MKGIYAIKINEKFYVGKDSQINKNKRLKEHLTLLKKNSHYNRYLQNAYNKYNGEYEYYILFEATKISNEELSDIEIFYIDYLDSYKRGYNLTLGGEGGTGIVISEEGKALRSERVKGELNPQAKLTNENFFEIVELFKVGKTNTEVGQQYGIHPQYVSLIRHKKRFKSLWDEVEEYTPTKSNGAIRGLSYEQFCELVDLLDEGWTNADLERKFSLGGGTGSRIRHKKLYKRYWNKYLEGQ